MLSVVYQIRKDAITMLSVSEGNRLFTEVIINLYLEIVTRFSYFGIKLYSCSNVVHCDDGRVGY